MSEGNKPMSNEMAQLMHSMGQLTGSVQAMHQGVVQRIEDIRQDMRRMEEAQGDRMDRIEDALTKRIDNVETKVSSQLAGIKADMNKHVDGLTTRVENLEAEDKKLIEKTAKIGALSGGLGSAAMAGLIEILKRWN